MMIFYIAIMTVLLLALFKALTSYYAYDKTLEDKSSSGKLQHPIVTGNKAPHPGEKEISDFSGFRSLIIGIRGRLATAASAESGSEQVVADHLNAAIAEVKLLEKVFELKEAEETLTYTREAANEERLH